MFGQFYEIKNWDFPEGQIKVSVTVTVHTKIDVNKINIPFF